MNRLLIQLIMGISILSFGHMFAMEEQPTLLNADDIAGQQQLTNMFCCFNDGREEYFAYLQNDDGKKELLYYIKERRGVKEAGILKANQEGLWEKVPSNTATCLLALLTVKDNFTTYDLRMKPPVAPVPRSVTSSPAPVKPKGVSLKHSWAGPSHSRSRSPSERSDK